MNIIISIFRWLLALGIGLVMYLFVIIAIPASIFIGQLFDSSSANRWITALTSDTSGMETFTESVFESLGTARNVEDPATRQLLAAMSNPASPVGVASRKVVTPSIVSKNIKENANSFYSWLDGKSKNLAFTVSLGGTQADRNRMVSESVKMYYESLPACTTTQKQAMAKNGGLLPDDMSCNFGPVPQKTFDEYAVAFWSAPELKGYINTGKPMVLQDVTEADREAMIALKGFSKGGVVIAWIVVVVSSIFMILLFTPSLAKWLVTGAIVASTGMTVAAMGGGSAAILNRVSTYGAAAETVMDAFAGTLGKPITQQGMYLILAGGLLFLVGIIKLFAKQKPSRRAAGATTVRDDTIVTETTTSTTKAAAAKHDTTNDDASSTRKSSAKDDAADKKSNDKDDTKDNDKDNDGKDDDNNSDNDGGDSDSSDD